MVKKVLTLSIVLNLLFIGMGMVAFLKLGGFSRFASAKTVSYADGRVATFSKLEVGKDNVVFVGDSITEGGEWSEIFHDSSILNRGINGDTTEGVLNRIDDILKGNPRKMFILIGINDLAHGMSPDEIEKNYVAIVKRVKNSSPNTELYIQSILPNNPSVGSKEVPSNKIIEFNKRLQKIAKNHSVSYVDLFPLFETNGSLNENLTYDGLHLKAEGYFLWTNSIKDLLN